MKTGIGAFEDGDTFRILHPGRLWCADESGFNDEAMAGTSVVRTKGNCTPTTQHGKSLRHATILSFVAASGESAPPAVVASGTLFQPDWQRVWPEAKIACNDKGSMTGPRPPPPPPPPPTQLPLRRVQRSGAPEPIPPPPPLHHHHPPPPSLQMQVRCGWS